MGKGNIDIFEASPQNIWNFKQNHPELVIKDIKNHLATTFSDTQIAFIQDIVRQSMLCRGINKWLKVRRDLIAYKKQIRHRIKYLNKIIPMLKNEMSLCYLAKSRSNVGAHEYYKAREQYMMAKTELKTLEEVRKSLKALCMTDRWQIWKGKKLPDMNTLTASDN